MKHQHNVDYLMVKRRLYLELRFFKTPTEFDHIYCPDWNRQKHVFSRIDSTSYLLPTWNRQKHVFSRIHSTSYLFPAWNIEKKWFKVFFEHDKAHYTLGMKGWKHALPEDVSSGCISYVPHLGLKGWKHVLLF